MVSSATSAALPVLYCPPGRWRFSQVTARSTDAETDAAGINGCLQRFAADLRRACAEGRIRGRFARGNALGLATALEATLAGGPAAPDAIRHLHQHLKGLLGHASGAPVVEERRRR